MILMTYEQFMKEKPKCRVGIVSQKELELIKKYLEKQNEQRRTN